MFGRLLIILAVMTGLTISLMAYSSGKDGRTSSTSGGCSCHTSNSSSSTSLSVTSQSGSFSVEPGSQNTYTVTVSNTGRDKAGVNIAVKTSQTGEINAGTLAAVTGSGLKTLNNELVHSSPKNVTSGSASFDFTWTAPSTPGVYYLRATGNAVNDNGSADNGDQWNFMSVREVNVKGVTLASLDGGEALCAGSQQAISWTHTGLTNVKIELSSNSGSSFDQVLAASVSADAGSWTWNIPGSFPNGANYRVRISDASNSNIKDQSSGNFSVNSSIVISTQPQNADICTGETLSLSVAAQGAGLKYKWRKDGSIITGATNAVYTKTNVTIADAGSYDCVVSADCGDDVTSEPAGVSIGNSVNITQDIQGTSVCPGANVSLTITATGDDLAYKWTKDGTEINGAVSNQYSITNIQETDEATYRCIVSGSCGNEKFSSNAKIIVKNPVTFVAQTADTSVCEGEKAELYVKASSIDANFQWKKDGSDITGATNAVYTIESTNSDSKGRYECQLTSSCGDKISSEKINLTINPLPVISKNPNNTETNTNEEVLLYVVASNADIFEWYRNGNAIPGSNNDTLKVIIRSESDFGTYLCKVSNGCSTVESAEATVSQRAAGPAISVLTDLIDFSEVLAGTEKVFETASFIGNAGDKELTITGISIEDGPDLSLEMPQFPLTLQPGEKAGFKLVYAPQSNGVLDAKLTFVSNAQNNSFIKIVGEAGTISFSYDESLEFGELEVDESLTLSTEIENTGTFMAEFSAPNIPVGNDGFSIISPLEPFSLASGEKKKIEVEFSPSEAKSYNSPILISESKFGTDFVINLSGAGMITSVAENGTDHEITISPNPSGSSIRIGFQGKEGIETIRIIDLNGETVYENRIGSLQKEFLWDIKNLNGERVPRGVYFAVLYTSKESYYLKIVISE